MASSATMPIGSPMSLPIRSQDVKTTEGNVAPAEYTEDAAAVIVWNNYQKAKNFVENDASAWLLEWQETDILYQSPIPNRRRRAEEGRPPRVPRFLVAKFTRTLARAVKRALFAEQYPFFLRPGSKTTQPQADAWTYLIGVLLKRMKFKYHGGLQINCQTLQGTGVGKFGWQERTIQKRTRRRKKPAERVTMPSGQEKEVPTKESDSFEEAVDTVTESWPFYEYRRLGTTLFDPKWCTPDEPEESAGYCIDVDFVNFFDLQEMRLLSCYQKTKNSQGIPSEEILKKWFFEKQEGSAPQGSQIEESMTAQGGYGAHAEARNRQTSVDPQAIPMLLLEQWDSRTVKTILHYDGRNIIIRNEEHNQGSMSHTTCTWWPIDNSGYGMGIGKINGPDQRINAGVINEALKMIAYPMNAPLVVGRGENAPTQNVIARHGGFWQVDTGPSGDVNKAVGFLKTPDVPVDAWKFVDLSQRGGAELSGADEQMQQGNLTGKQGATRSATGASRVAAMSDQNVADPVDSFADGVIVKVVEFLIHMVKTKMPLKELRQILNAEYFTVIKRAIDQEQFLAAEFEVTVLAGQKLAAKQGIQQLIPFFLQIVQQPQLLEYLHQRGDTISFEEIMDLLLQVSELQQQPNIFRHMTDRELAMVQKMNPNAQKTQAAATVESMRGQNKVKEIRAKGETDLGVKAAEIAMQHISDGLPLERAVGLVERGQDVQTLRGGLPDTMQE